MVAPTGSPRVFEDEIFTAVIPSVANDKQLMIEICSALIRVKNASHIGLERELICFDSDTHWLLYDGLLDCLNGSINIFDIFDFCPDFFSFKVAFREALT